MTHEEHQLGRVLNAARVRRSSEDYFREAICQAHLEGVSVVKLAVAAGVSRPTIYATLKRGAS